MKIILLNLLTGFSIGSLVAFNGKLFRIESVYLTHWFKKELLFKRKFNLIIILRNEYGGIEVVGYKKLEKPHMVFNSWDDIPKGLK